MQELFIRKSKFQIRYDLRVSVKSVKKTNITLVIKVKIQIQKIIYIFTKKHHFFECST